MGDALHGVASVARETPVVRVATRRFNGKGLLAESTAFAAMSVASVAHANTVIYVDASSPANGNGESWETAFNSLQSACDVLNSQNHPLQVEVRIARGQYRATTLSATGAAFTLGPGALASTATISIKGSYLGSASATPNARDFVSATTVLSGDVLNDDSPEWGNTGDNAKSVLTISMESQNITVWLDGLRVEGGVGGAWAHDDFLNARRTGAGVQVLAGALDGLVRVTNCTFTRNWADRGGGGLSIVPSSLNTSRIGIVLQSCEFTNNFARDPFGGAGALFLWNFGEYAPPVDVIACAFDGNLASYGGGLTTVARDVHVNTSRFRGNQALNSGGVYALGADAVLSSCLLADNMILQAGGSAVTAMNVTGHNLTIVNNISENAAIHADTVTLSNSVLFHNRNSDNARDLHVGDEVRISNSIVNLHDEMRGQIYGGGSLHPDSVGIFVFDPQFIDSDGADNNPATWFDNNYRLKPRSPAIDAGIIDTSLTIVDLDSNDRFVSGIIGRPPTLDLGCYESQLSLCPADLTADNAVTIDDLLDFLSHFELGQPLADLTTNGSTPFPDGGVTIDDLLFFLLKFEQGC